MAGSEIQKLNCCEDSTSLASRMLRTLPSNCSSPAAQWLPLSRRRHDDRQPRTPSPRGRTRLPEREFRNRFSGEWSPVSLPFQDSGLWPALALVRGQLRQEPHSARADTAPRAGGITSCNNRRTQFRRKLEPTAKVLAGKRRSAKNRSAEGPSMSAVADAVFANGVFPDRFLADPLLS